MSRTFSSNISALIISINLFVQNILQNQLYASVLMFAILIIIYIIHGICLYFYYDKNKSIKHNQLIISLKDYKNVVKKEKGLSLESILVKLIESIYLIADTPRNIIQFLSKPPNASIKYRKHMDILVIFYFSAGILSFFFFQSNSNTFGVIMALLFISRIISIIFSKLLEIIHLNNNCSKEVSSFNRIFFISMINLLELTVCYSFLYSYYNIAPAGQKSITIILNTLKIFTTQGVPQDWSKLELHFLQSVLIISQLLVFVIFFLVFFANILNLKYTKNQVKRPVKWISFIPLIKNNHLKLRK